MTSPAPLASPDRIKQLLASGRTAQQVADLTGWPRNRVVALVTNTKGWLLDPQSDTVYQPGGTEAPDLLTVDGLLAHAAGLDDKNVQRELTKANEAITRLRASISTVTERLAEQRRLEEERTKAVAEVSALERKLAEAKARVKAIAAGKRPAPAGRPAPALVRAWAAEHGVTCSPFGKVPQPVVDQYLAALAHPNGDTPV